MRALRVYTPNQVLLLLSHRYPSVLRRYASTAESLPRVAQPSFWHSIIPKIFRERDRASNKVQAPKSKDWNPATFFIVIFLLIGSNAIQMIALRNDFLAFSRKTDAKIGLLREVLERVQKGEEVDVKGLLGTGNREQEKEWDEVLREIENEGLVVESKAEKKEARRVRKAEEDGSAPAETDSNSNSNALPGRTLEDYEQKESEDKQAADQTENTPEKPKRRPLAFH